MLAPPKEARALAPHQAQAPQAYSSAPVGCMQALHAQECALLMTLQACSGKAVPQAARSFPCHFMRCTRSIPAGVSELQAPKPLNTGVANKRHPAAGTKATPECTEQSVCTKKEAA